jgi:hypothetical protein
MQYTPELFPIQAALKATMLLLVRTDPTALPTQIQDGDVSNDMVFMPQICRLKSRLRSDKGTDRKHTLKIFYRILKEKFRT